jgi:hypothetical protein
MRGIFETHLDVIDLDRSLLFYGAILGLEVALRREVADAPRADAHSLGARRFALLWVDARPQPDLGVLSWSEWTRAVQGAG